MIEYFTTNLWTIWLSISIICMIIEVNSGDFYVTCFAIGAIGSMIASLFPIPLWAQVLIWAVCTILSIYFIRPSLVRKFHGKEQERTSNADALIGRQGFVIEEIKADGHGYIKIDGDEWRSVSENGECIKVGEKVEIISKESIVMTVRRIIQ